MAEQRQALTGSDWSPPTSLETALAFTVFDAQSTSTFYLDISSNPLTRHPSCRNQSMTIQFELRKTV